MAVPWNGRLTGIVTETDLVPVLVELLGLLTQSTRLDVGVAEGPDAYERIVEIIRSHDGRIISVGAVTGSEGKTVFSVGLEPCNPGPIVDGRFVDAVHIHMARGTLAHARLVGVLA